MQFPATDIIAAVRTALGGADAPASSLHVVDATQLATALMGDAIATNLFILGYAWQQALVPLSFESIMRAVELNGAAIEMNKTAFAWGRLAAIDPQAVAESARVVRNAQTTAEATPHALPMLSPGQWEGHEFGSPSAPRALRNEDELRHVRADAGADVAFLPLDDARLSRSLDEVVSRRVKFLTDYQNAAYAKRYADFVAKVRDTEARKAPGSTDLTEAVARYAFKLMAYKDEYEVARLHADPRFLAKVAGQFEGELGKDYKDAAQMKEVVDWVMTSVRPNVLKYTSDSSEMQQLLRSGAANAVTFWNSLARLEYFGGHTDASLLVPSTIYPANGYLWIPKGAPHPVLAQIFINWRLGPDVQFPNKWPIEHGPWSELSEGFLGPDYVSHVPDWFKADYFNYFPNLDQIKTQFKTVDWAAYNKGQKEWQDYYAQKIGQ